MTLNDLKLSITDGPTDWLTDRVGHRVACTRLKSEREKKINERVKKWSGKEMIKYGTEMLESEIPPKVGNTGEKWKWVMGGNGGKKWKKMSGNGGMKRINRQCKRNVWNDEAVIGDVLMSKGPQKDICWNLSPEPTDRNRQPQIPQWP